MIAPLDLTTEELEIYKLLYKKMDFDTFEVKYTTDQLVADSNKKLELTFKKVYKILKDFEDNDYIYKLKRGSKGNPTTYKINQIREIKSNLKESYEEVKSNLKENNKEIKTEELQQFDDLEVNNKEIKSKLKVNNKEIKGKTKVNPINDKDKDKDKENIYKLIVDKWNNEVDLPKVKSITDKRKGAINARIKEHGKEAIIQVVENVSKSDFLQGKVGKWNNCNFDWSFKPNNFAKILEGNYNKTTTVKEEKKEVIYNPDSEFKNLSLDDLKARFKNA